MNLLAECEDCGWIGPAYRCGEIEDFHQRVEPGEECPVGECPECRSLAHLID